VERLLAIEHAAGTVSERGRPGTATVFGAPHLSSTAERAAFLNATAGSFLELDEGVRPTGHPGMQVVVPALAAAEATAADGTALLTAVLAGYEVASRLFSGFRLTYPVHPHGHFGAVGGAVAVALVTGADPLEAARIAATSPILSIWDACYDGATARNTWMGSAAQSAVRASALAQAGFTGSARAFEIAFGEIAGTLIDEDAITAPLDYDRLGIRRNYFKLHSACALTHAALDAVFRLAPIDIGAIDRIVVETVSNNMKLDRQAAPNALSARFSLPYAVAAGAVLGRIDPDSFVYREDIARLAERVEVRVAADLEARWPESSPARVTVESRDGTRAAEVQNPHGHHLDPVDAAELRAKFDRLVADPVVAESWWRGLTGLAEVKDCSQLFDGRAP
jgi:2-methylcitrate dehydratase PrpD